MYIANDPQTLVETFGIREHSARRYLMAIEDLRNLKQRQTDLEDASHAAEYFWEAFNLALRTTCEFRAAHYNLEARRAGDSTFVIVRPQVVKPYSPHIPIDMPESLEVLPEHTPDYHTLLKRFYQEHDRHAMVTLKKSVTMVVDESLMLPIFVGEQEAYGLENIPLNSCIRTHIELENDPPEFQRYGVITEKDISGNYSLEQVLRETLKRTRFRIAPHDHVLTLEETTYLLLDAAGDKPEDQPHYESRFGLALISDFAKHECTELRETIDALIDPYLRRLHTDIRKKEAQKARLETQPTSFTYLEPERAFLLLDRISELTEQVERAKTYQRIVSTNKEQMRELLRILRPGAIRPAA